MQWSAEIFGFARKNCKSDDLIEKPESLNLEFKVKLRCLQIQDLA